MFIQNPRSLKNNSQPNFGALKVASAKNYVKGRETLIDIYKLTKNDNDFIDILEKSTDYHRLASSLKSDMQERWQKVFHYCIEEMKDGYNQNFVAVSNNKPCGILTYYANGTSSYLDGVCKIPAPVEEDVHLTGQTLILNFLKAAQQANSKTVGLDAVKDGPFDVISLYEKLGFKKVFHPDDEGKYQPMEMNKFKLKEQIKKLEKVIKYQEEKGKEEVNLIDLLG